jgi:peptidyl-prolyl cis-trans isomerase C
LSLLGAALWAQAPAVKPAAPAAAPVASPAAAADPVVLTVNGEKWTKSQFERILQTLPANVQSQAATPEGKRQIADRLAEMQILATEARRLGVQSQPAIAAQLKMQEQSVLASALYTQLAASHKLTDAEAKAEYETRKGEFETAKTRHILIRFQGSRVPVKEGGKELTDAEALAKAQALRARIVKGEDFAAIAKAESDDTGSGKDGGDLGENPRGRFVPEFDTAAFSLPINQVSEPVKTAFGYHLIQVTARGTVPLEQVRPDLEHEQQAAYADEQIKALKVKAGLKLDDAYFGPVAPARPEPGTPKAK